MLSSEPVEHVRRLLRERVPTLTDDRHMAPDMAIATDLVRSKRLLVAVGELPGVVG